jgi:heme-degrading monooxygenase HmoA
MTVARHYRMTAAEGKGEALVGALRALAAALKSIPGYEGSDLIRGVEDANQFVFIEKWASVEAHKAGGPLLPKEVLGGLMGNLAGPPEGAYLNYLSVD